MCNSMHDCSTAKGDAFLKTFIPKLLKSPAMKGSVLFLTWDEGTSDLGGGGRIATVVDRTDRQAGLPLDHAAHPLLAAADDRDGLGSRLPQPVVLGEHPARVLPLGRSTSIA